MSEKEQRLAYNQRAAELNAKYQMRRYPGMIQSVEIPPMGNQGGIGLIAVTDAIYNSKELTDDQRYCPSPGMRLVDGREAKTPGQLRGDKSIMAPPGQQKTLKPTPAAPLNEGRRYNLRSFLK